MTSSPSRSAFCFSTCLLFISLRIPWAAAFAGTNIAAVTAVEQADTGLASGLALVIGCGLGDDAEELARLGFMGSAHPNLKTVR